MANIIVSNKNVAGAFNPTKNTLTAADVLPYSAGQSLLMYNTTASAVVVTIDGDGGTTVAVPDSGGATFSVAAGLAVTVPANGFTIVNLDTIKAYLKGTVAVTGGVGVVAVLLSA